jgi:hypothetical protein
MPRRTLRYYRAVLSVRGAVAAVVVFATMAVSSWGQSKLVQVEDPFPAVDCTAYDTGKYITDKHSEACRSFVQLVKAKDRTLPDPRRSSVCVLRDQ